MPQPFDPLDYGLLVLGGFAAGVINSLAGNGSAITLTLLMGMGLSPAWANATNRIGVVFQTITAVLSLPRNEQLRELRKKTSAWILPSVLGTIIGALCADEVPEVWLNRSIGGVMLFLLLTLIFKPQKWQVGSSEVKRDGGIKMVLYFFLIGLYAGYLQMGIGIMILAVLVLSARYTLVEANVVKLLIALVLTIPAFFVFSFSGKMNWPMGITLGIGQMLGAWFGTRRLLQHPRAAIWIHYLLILILGYAVLRIFGLFKFFAF
jgi:uncharacterized membrane protein YfcA